MRQQHLSVAEAATRLHVTPARVRALIASGDLRATKLGGRWLVDADALEHRRTRAIPAGRPFSPTTAWAALALADGEPASRSSPSARSRLRRWLREVGIEQGLPFLRRRARPVHLRAHPSDLSRLAAEARVVATGISAASAHGADIGPRQELEAYVHESQFESLRRKYALAESDTPNVILRLVSAPWPFARATRIAPRAVAAVDLLDSSDQRTRRAGRALLPGNAR